MEFALGKIDDIDEICFLIESAKEEMKRNGINQWDEIYPTREDFVCDIESGNLYTVRENNLLAAIYVVSQECDDEYKKCMWIGKDEKAMIIHRLCVSPDFQNRGVAKKILTHIEQQLSEMKMESIRLDVFSENPYALKLYEKAGYIKKGFADWRKGRFFLMEKIL